MLKHSPQTTVCEHNLCTVIPDTLWPTGNAPIVTPAVWALGLKTHAFMSSGRARDDDEFLYMGQMNNMSLGYYC